MPVSREFQRGWKVVLAASLGVGTGLSPLPFYTIGVFVAPLSAAFGWRVDQILAVLIITTLSVLVCGPIVGILTDRYGVRPIALLSTTGYGLCFILFALNRGSLLLFYANYALLAIVGVGTLPITWTRAVNNRFKENRGLALGLSLVLTGVFGLLAKMWVEWLIVVSGWRLAYAGLSLFPLLIALPVAIAFFHDADENQRGNEAPLSQEGGISLADALKTRRFWTIAASLILLMLPVGGIIPNLEPMLKSKGFSTGTAVELAGIIGIAVLVARPVGGWLIDRFWAPGVAFCLMIPPAIAFFMLSHFTITVPLAAFGIFMIGFASGVEYDVVAYLVSRYFGMRHYSSVYGSLYVAFAAGGGAGPYLIGHVFTVQKTYDGILLVSAPIVIAGAALLLTLGKYPLFSTDANPGALQSRKTLPSAEIDPTRTAPSRH